MAKRVNTRVDTQLEGTLITSDDLYRQAKAWSNIVRSRAKSNTSAFAKGKKGSKTYSKSTKWHKPGETEPKLSRSLSYVIKEISGITDNIKFRFPRHGIFRSYGVGNGQSINGKQAIKTHIKRNPSDWIDEPIDSNIDKLADIAADFYGDEVLINSYAMKVKQ